jgi:hypothetical protein
VGINLRLDLRKIMLENRPYGTIPLKIEKKRLPRPQDSAKTTDSWHANRGQHFTRGWDRITIEVFHILACIGIQALERLQRLVAKV